MTGPEEDEDGSALPGAAEPSRAADQAEPPEISAVPGEAEFAAEDDGEATALGGAGAIDGVAESAAAEDAEDIEAAAEPRGSRYHRGRMAFRRWRHTRPFWGGFLAALGGGEILFTYKAPLKVLIHFGLYGLAGYAVPALLAVCGLLLLFDPQHRTFYSILVVLSACGSWLTSNLGGFLIGTILGVIGGSLAFGWMPGAREPRKPREHRILRRMVRRSAA